MALSFGPAPVHAQFDGAGGPGPAGSFLPAAASFALPGSGQLLLGQRRGWAYLAAEAAAWTVFLDRRSKARADRTRYRQLAWEVARDGVLPRVDGDFGYYERMSEWPRSGRYDRDPDMPGVQPEIDGLTYNGAIWLRAQAIYGVDPSNPDANPDRYAGAVGYYESRAYDDSLLWDWGDEEASRDLFRSLIRDSDERFRHATIALGAVIANHIFSAGDALVSTRLSTRIVPSSRSARGWEMAFHWLWTP